MKNVLRVCSLLLVLLVAGLGQPLTSAAQDAFYGFGDSLSDTGNLFLGSGLAIPPSGAYFQGRFSNGPVAFEYLWRLLKRNAAVRPILAEPGPSPTLKGGISFAFGGAESGVSNLVPGGFVVPGLLGQVEKFRAALKGRKPRPHALYGVWAGANDYLSDPTTAPTVVVGNITSAIEGLHALGARRFIVLNLPDLGSLPIVQAQGPQAVAVFTELTGVHNALLAQSLAGLEAQLARVKIVRIDVFALTRAFAGSEGIVSPPALEFLTDDPAAPFCLFTNPTTCPDVRFDPGDDYIFWDAEHPTTLVHELLGQAMFEALRQ